MKDKWTDKESAETVLKWATNTHVLAMKESIEASANLAGNTLAEKDWDKAVKIAAKLWDKAASNNTENPFSAKAKMLEKQETERHDNEERWLRIKEFVIGKISNLSERKTNKAPVKKACVRKPNP